MDFFDLCQLGRIADDLLSGQIMHTLELFDGTS